MRFKADTWEQFRHNGSTLINPYGVTGTLHTRCPCVVTVDKSLIGFQTQFPNKPAPTYTLWK